MEINDCENFVAYRMKLDYLLKKNPAVSAAIKQKHINCETR